MAVAATRPQAHRARSAMSRQGRAVRGHLARPFLKQKRLGGDCIAYHAQKGGHMSPRAPTLPAEALRGTQTQMPRLTARMKRGSTFNKTKYGRHKLIGSAAKLVDQFYAEWLVIWAAVMGDPTGEDWRR